MFGLKYGTLAVKPTVFRQEAAMEKRPLTPRQLLVLVLTACCDAGYDVLSKQRVMDALWEMRDLGLPLVPALEFSLSGNRRSCYAIEQALNGLHRTGVSFDAVAGTLTVSDTLSDAEVYKPLHDADRERYKLALAPYIGEFVQHITRPDERAPEEKPDPRHS